MLLTVMREFSISSAVRTGPLAPRFSIALGSGVLLVFAVLVLPLVIALLFAALGAPVVSLLQRAAVPRKLGAGLVVLSGLGFVVLLLTFVGQQIADDVDDQTFRVPLHATWTTGPISEIDDRVDAGVEAGECAVELCERLGSHRTVERLRQLRNEVERRRSHRGARELADRIRAFRPPSSVEC